MERLAIGLLLLAPAGAAILLWFSVRDAFPIESVNFAGYRVLPFFFALGMTVLALRWLSARIPPRRLTLTAAGAVAVYSATGYFYFPLTFAILVAPLLGWAILIALLARRMDWIGPPPLPLFRGIAREIIPLTPAAQPTPPPAPAAPPDPASAESEALRHRFERLRQELKPPEPPAGPLRPSPVFLALLAVVSGAGLATLQLPSAPATIPLYGQQTEGFIAEPGWDPLLLRPSEAPYLRALTEAETEDIPRWRPGPRLAEPLPEWNERLNAGGTRILFSPTSSLARIETRGAAANVNPLMSLPRVSADGFPLTAWNQGSLTPGGSTAWQEWSLGKWTALVRYSGDPWISGAWTSESRRGAGPWLGKVAAQVEPETGAAALTAVNRLNVELGAREVDLCNLTLEPLSSARIVWGLIPPQETLLEPGAIIRLRRAATGVALIERPVSGEREKASEFLEFKSWVILRGAPDGPGFLVFCPFWQRQVGLEHSPRTPSRRPANCITLTLEGVSAQARFSLLAPMENQGGAIAKMAPGTYLNSLILVPVEAGDPDEKALESLREILARNAPPMLAL